MPGFSDPRGFFQPQQFHISVITSPSKPFPERADLQTEAPSAQLLRRILIQQRSVCLREERDLMSKLNTCTMLSSHWQISWILMALPLELAFSRELCSHQPCADQHISNRGTHAPSYASPPHSSLLPVSFLKGIVLLFWQRNPVVPREYTERKNNRYGLRKVWKLLLQNQESEMETSLVEDWVKISS